MSDGFVQQPPDSTGKKVSTEEFTRGSGDVVEIQRIQVVDGSEVRQGTSSAPFRTDPTGATTQPISGTVAISGTVNVDSELTTADLDTGAGTDTRAVVGLVLAESGGGLLVGSAHPLPVSGTITANAGSGTFTNQQSNVTADYDSGAGTQTLTMFGMALPASGGAVAGGTATNPVRVDPTGTTTQPVSGTLIANIGTSGSLALDASVTGLQVAQGSTTSGQSGGLVQGAVTTAAPTYTTAKTSPLSLTTAGALRVDASATTQPVSGTVAVSGTVTVDSELTTADLDTGAGTDTRAVVGLVLAASGGGLLVGSANPLPVSGTITVSQSTAASLNATVTGTVAATQSGTWTVQPGNTANTTPWLVDEARPGTATLANVASSATSVTLQAANTARKGWTCYNDSTSQLFIKFGTTASATSFNVLVPAGGYFEAPHPCYTGRIDGIWSAANGNARVMELT